MRRPSTPVRLTLLLLTATVAATLGLSCGKSDSSADSSAGAGGSAKDADTLTFINRGELGTLDPKDMSWMQDIRIAYGLWEGLYRIDPATIKPIPGAAEKVDVSADKKTYTFHLRTGAKWSNGDPVTAGDFAFAWKRMLTPPAGQYTYLLFYIKGAKGYLDALPKDPKSADWSKVGIKVKDDQTLVVTLKNPTPFFPDVLAFPAAFPLNQKSMAAFARTDETTGIVTYDASFAKPPALVGNGPYVLADWRVRVGQTLVKNPNYWDAAHTRTNTIRSLSVEDPLLAFQQYESGQVDWLADLGGDQAASMRAQDRKDAHIFPALGTYYYVFNCKPTLPDGQKNPFADKRVRQAFAMAVKKQPIVDNITRLGEPVRDYLVPPDFPGYPKAKGIDFNLDKARQLLADAGYPGGAGFPQVNLLYNTEEKNHGDIAQYLSKLWGDELGVKLGLEGVEINQFRQRRQKTDFALARAGWYGDYNDVSTFTDLFSSDSENNDGRWKSADYDELLAAAEIEPDAQKRLGLLSKAEQILLDDAAIIPLYGYVNKMAYHANVEGITDNARMTFMLQAIAVRK